MGKPSKMLKFETVSDAIGAKVTDLVITHMGGGTVSVLVELDNGLVFDVWPEVVGSKLDVSRSVEPTVEDENLEMTRIIRDRLWRTDDE